MLQLKIRKWNVVSYLNSFFGLIGITRGFYWILWKLNDTWGNLKSSNLQPNLDIIIHILRFLDSLFRRRKTALEWKVWVFYFWEWCSNFMPTNGLSVFLIFKYRIWWVFAFSLSLCLCGISIRSILNSWNETPVMMSLTEKNVPISAIPFPTVSSALHNGEKF